MEPDAARGALAEALVGLRFRVMRFSMGSERRGDGR